MGFDTYLCIIIGKRNKMNNFLKWWLIFCISILGMYIAHIFGWITEIWSQDQTKISFVIIGLYILTSLNIGWVTWKKAKGKNVDSALSVGWFFSESMLALGMIGTVAGFILMLGVSFAEIDATQVETLREALKSMALGMSTALYTTLVGLICSQFFKLQLVNVENS